MTPRQQFREALYGGEKRKRFTIYKLIYRNKETGVQGPYPVCVWEKSRMVKSGCNGHEFTIKPVI